MAIYFDDKIDFYQRTIRKNRFKMPHAHYHDKNEFYFCEKGQVKFFVYNKIYILEPGDIIFVPPGVFHKTDSAETSTVERVLLSFDDSFVYKSFAHYLDELKKKKHIHIPHEKLYEVQDIFLKMEKENTKRHSGYVEMEKLLLCQLLIIISRYSTNEVHAKLNESYKIIQSAAKHISENYDKELSLELLAQKYAMSPSYFSKQFKNVTGIGVNEHINISRITAAEKMLSETNLPITVIATKCGYNDSNYFAAVFKKMKGITPKKYSLQHNHT